MKQVFLKSLCIGLLGFALSIIYFPALSADEDSPSAGDVIDMIAGDIQSVPADNLVRVSVTNPEVADISDVESDKVSLIAKKAGSTILFLWDAAGKRSVKVRVAGEDLAALKDRVQKLLEEAGIAGVSMEENFDIGKVVLTGSLSNDDKNRLSDILEPYGDNLVNMIKTEKYEDLIQVDMQIVEISTSLEKNLGILWGNPSSSFTFNSSGTQTSPTNNGLGLNMDYVENTPPGDKFADLFKIGNFEQASSMEATVNALIQEGKARLISKPRLVVVSGKQASFLVGGEIPIESTTVSTTGGTLTNNVTYAEYGVNLSVTPTLKEGKIDVLLNVDIRDVDNSTPITSSGGGDNIAFITRTASTDLLMDNRQTIALAGLIKYEDSVTVTKIPFLSSIPLVGGLFRNRSEPADANTEMVIILTPTVLTEKKYAQKQLVMPTPEERESWKEIDAKYEHEPIVSNWPPSQGASAAPATSDLWGISTETTAYARMVQEKISRAILYPVSAAGMDAAGTVKLKLHILKDGSLDSEEVVESSGNNILDQDAMQAARIAAPFDAFTPGMDQQDMVFTIPIVFNRGISGGQTPVEKVIATY